MVFVSDIRCGNNANKVLVCHNGNTICVSPNAVPAHLAHGDQLGPCGDNPGITSGDIPSVFKLHVNYPNPFNPATKIRFDVPKNVFISIKIFDVLGREVVTLINEDLQPGKYEVHWDASQFSSGVYYYIMKAGDFTETRKMILMK
jgi:hypothetical protein